MYCIEKHLAKYNFKPSIVTILNNYICYNDYGYKSLNFLIESQQGFTFKYFLNKYFISPTYTREDTVRGINNILKYLCMKSKVNFNALNTGGNSFAHISKSGADILNGIIWSFFNQSKLMKSELRLLINNIYHKNYINEEQVSIWLTLAWLLFELQFRLNKKELKMYEEDPIKFLDYIEGINAITNI